MPFGRGWFGRGWGRGNPYPFCRNFPWLPRWWWATSYAGIYGGPTLYMGYPGYGYPYYGARGFYSPAASGVPYGPVPRWWSRW